MADDCERRRLSRSISLFFKHMHTPVVRTLCVVGLFALTGAATQATAATLPVAENFDDGVANGFVTAGSGSGYTFAGSTGTYAYQTVVNSTGPLNASAAISVTGLPTAGYELSTTFKLGAFSTAGAANVGFGLHGDTADFSTGTQYRVLYQLAGSDAGRLQFIRNGVFVGYSTGVIPPVVGQDYTFKVRVTPAASGYTLRGTLTSGTVSIAVEVAQSALLSGSYFGYRTAINASSVTVGYDNFNMEMATTDLVVTGDLTVLGNTDLVGNSLKIGGTGTGDEAVKIDYTEVGSTYKQSTVATRDAVEFFWGQNGAGTTKPKMTLGADNTLTLFSLAGDAKIIINPDEGYVRVNGANIPLNYGGGAVDAVGLSNGAALGARSTGLSEGVAFGIGSTAISYGIAEGTHSVAMSAGSATGELSVAMGGYALGERSVAMSLGVASTWLATAMSAGIAEGPASIAMTYGQAHHAFSAAIGVGVNTYGDHQMVVGVNNAVGGDPDDLFVVGNGGVSQSDADPAAASTALVINKNGNARLGGSLQVKGGIRIPPGGDISMGDFDEGDNPADLNKALRYDTP